MRREQLAPYEAHISVLALSTLHHRTLRRFHNRWDNLFQRAIQPQQVKSEKNTPDFTWKSGVSRPIHPVPSCGALRFPVCCDTLQHSADGKLTLQNSLSAYPLYTANGLRRQVVADAADARNFGGNACSDALQQRPVKLGNLGGHNINGVDAANDAGRLLGSMQSSFEFGWNTS